jgi:hypothetical protein
MKVERWRHGKLTTASRKVMCSFDFLCAADSPIR